MNKLFVVFALIASLLVGCRQKTAVSTVQSADTVRHIAATAADYRESNATTDSVRETLIIRETVDTSGNTLRQVIIRDVYRQHDNTATIQQLQNTIDSLEATRTSETVSPAPVAVEAKSWWSTLLRNVGLFTLGLVSAVVAIAVIWLAKRYKR
jgi:hypothetical protein